MHATSCIELALGVIGETAIDATSLGFNDLGRSVILFTIISTPKMSKKSMLEVKIFKIFVHGTRNPAILWLQGAWNHDS